jgi:4-alpha-methyl-delta7-sterol-4alpha-methyl oxidase
MAVPQNALERAWLLLTDNFTEFQLASIGSFIIHESVYFLSGIPFLLMEMYNVRKYKIQVSCL